MSTVELDIPPRSAYVGVARLAISSLARDAGIDEERVDELKIAVSEACTNAISSTEEAGSDAPVSLSWTEDGRRLTLVVADRGTTYDPGAATDDTDSQGFSSRLVMSVALLQSLADECEFSPRDGGGMTTRLVFHR